MSSFRRALAFIALALMLSGFIALGRRAEAVSAPNTLGVLATTGGFGQVSSPSRYGHVVLNAWEFDKIAALKAANPAVKVLVYKCMASTRSSSSSDDQSQIPTGVSYAYANAQHPEWFLTSSSGGRMEWVGWPGHLWMDVGSQSYQDTWADNVVRELQLRGWDGVMVDNASFYLPAYYGHPAKYPNPTAYRPANDNFIQRVSSRLMAAGFEVLPNLGGGDYTGDQFRTTVAMTSGAVREFFATWDVAPFGGATWSRQMEQMDAVSAMGKIFMGITYGSPSDSRLSRMARASFLLGWNGQNGFQTLVPAGGDPWSSDWTTDIGLPLAPRYLVGSAWRRDYSGGVALVNPSAANVTVDLGSARVLPDGSSAQIVTLAPVSGLVVRNVGGVVTPPPVTTSTTTPTSTTLAPAPVASPVPAQGRDYYFADGYTGSGFSEFLTVLNMNTTAANMRLEFLFPSGPPTVASYRVGASSRTTIDVNAIVGRDREVSVHLVADADVVVERPMYFHYKGGIDGGSSVMGVRAPRQEHLYAEGYTGSGFDEYLSLLNPSSSGATVRATYTFANGQSVTRGHVVPAQSRRTVRVSDDVGVDKEVSVRLTSDVPIVTERPIYFRYDGSITGGTTATGLETPSTRFLFAEGYTGAGFHAYYTLQNPGSTDARVQITYRLADGTARQFIHNVRRMSRATVDVNAEVGPGAQFGAEIQSDQPIVAERPTYFLYGAIDGGSLVMGATEAAVNVAFAEGYTGPGFEEYLVLMNPGDTEAMADITFLFPDGSQLRHSRAVAARSRSTVRVNDVVGPGREVSAVVRSSAPLVSERVMYFRFSSSITGGSAVLGARLS